MGEQERLRPQERERAAMFRRALEQVDRAEQLLVELLAQRNLDGESPWEIAQWEEMLDHVASVHAHMQLIKAHIGVPWTEEG